jgi:hypothetical protein
LGHDATSLRDQVLSKVDKDDVDVVVASIQLKSLLTVDGTPYYKVHRLFKLKSFGLEGCGWSWFRCYQYRGFH